MKKDIDKYIPAALKAVKEIPIDPKDKGKVYEEYDGYAASLGPAIITSGLKPALVFYTDIQRIKAKDKPWHPHRFHILNAIASILAEIEEFEFKQKNTKLIDYVIDHSEEEKPLKKKILAASVALKLALRNFEHIQSPAKS